MQIPQKKLCQGKNGKLTEPINLIGYIESVKGSMRANHYHPVQEQKVLLVKGQFISLYKSLLEKNAPKITHVVNEGDSVVTKVVVIVPLITD